MNFKDIRKILDKYTVDCMECPYKDIEEEPDENDLIPYESCNINCNTYWAKQIKKEIMSLIDNIPIEVT